jgi:hypothetical protein
MHYKNLLMIAMSSSRRKTLGLGFPGCGSGVIVPISTKPNPILNKPFSASAFLSKPAAHPIGFSKVRSKAFSL